MQAHGGPRERDHLRKDLATSIELGGVARTA
jgi:hypothetical protein